MNATEFRRQMAELGPIPKDKPPKWSWARNRAEIRQHAEKSDPTLFIRWSTIDATMHVGNAPYLPDEAQYVIGDGNLRWAKAVIDPEFGGGATYNAMPLMSTNLIHQAYHLKQWCDASGTKTKALRSFEHVVEFGGGYGAMSLILDRLGFEGIHTIVDFPELLLLQRYFVSNVGLEKTHISACPPSIVHTIAARANLVIACWSLSEAPIKARDKFLDHCADPGGYLFAFQPVWDGVDNYTYFEDFAKAHDAYTWELRYAAAGSLYLLGWKDEGEE